MPFLRSTLKRAAALDHDADVMLGNQLHMMDNSVKINEQMAIGADQLKQHDLPKPWGQGQLAPKILIMVKNSRKMLRSRI